MRSMQVGQLLIQTCTPLLRSGSISIAIHTVTVENIVRYMMDYILNYTHVLIAQADLEKSGQKSGLGPRLGLGENARHNGRPSVQTELHG